MNLSQFNKGQTGIIAAIEGADSDPITLRLMELGLVQGSRVELVHEAPYGGDPIAVRVRGTLIALRRSEAARVEIAADISGVRA
jgi:ferrous iron transport protein A